MTESKILYLVINEINFHKLIDGRIPKHDFKCIDMYQTLEMAVEESPRISREKSKDRKFIPVVCEISYSRDELVQLYMERRLVPPAWWLVANHLADPKKIDPADLILFERSYPTVSFDFYNISIFKQEIIKAYSISDKGIAVDIYQKQ